MKIKLIPFFSDDVSANLIYYPKDLKNTYGFQWTFYPFYLKESVGYDKKFKYQGCSHWISHVGLIVMDN